MSSTNIYRLVRLVLSFMFILGSLPVAIFTEIELNGCCGAPNTGNGGTGYILGIILFLIGIILFITAINFRNIFNNSENNKSKLFNRLLLTILIIIISIPSYLIISTMIKDNIYRQKQVKCAKEVGYDSPGDDNYGKSTAKSQEAFRACINR